MLFFVTSADNLKVCKGILFRWMLSYEVVSVCLFCDHKTTSVKQVSWLRGVWAKWYVLCSEILYFLQGNLGLRYAGHHGYDNKEDDMKTTLIASGPHFKSGYRQTCMNSVDLYPLMCKILGLRTCHRSSGCLKNTRNLVDWWAIRRDRRTKLRFLNRH